MDYEKAYKAALETAAQWIKDGCTDKEKICLEGCFPELRESEDERIRKAIWLVLVATEEEQDVFYRTHNLTRKECTDWLEKQKEQNGMWSEDDERKVEVMCKEGNLKPSEREWLKNLKYRLQKEHKPILEVFGFKVGDAVRLKDGDGRKHIIKSFEEVKGIHGPNFYLVEFEDNSARDGIYPGKKYPSGYYTHMEKFEEEQKSIPPEDEKDFLEKEVKAFLCSYDKEFDDDAPAYDIAEHFYRLGKKAQEEQKPAENGTRTKIINRATNEKQVVLLSESNGSAEIDWDTRSLEDTKKLLEHGIAFINKQLGTKPAEWGLTDELDAGKISRYEDNDTLSLKEASEMILKHFNELRKK